jgi:hypothetical protein
VEEKLKLGRKKIEEYNEQLFRSNEILAKSLSKS